MEWLKMEDSISIREIELPFRNFVLFSPFGKIIDQRLATLHSLPAAPFVEPEMPRCGPDQISPMYDLGFRFGLPPFHETRMYLGAKRLKRTCLTSLLSGDRWGFIFDCSKAGADEPKLLLRPF